MSDLVAPQAKNYLFDYTTPYQTLLGGRLSTKTTIHAIKYALLLSQVPKCEIVVVRNFYNTIKDSAFRDIINAFSMIGMPLEQGKHYPRGSQLWIRLDNGNYIHFAAMDSWEKLKGLKPTKPGNSIVSLWNFELDQFDSQDRGITQVVSSLVRGQKPKCPYTGKPIWFVSNEWNPHKSITHWSYTYLDRLQRASNSKVLRLNYCDLPYEKQLEWFGINALNEIEELKKLNMEEYKQVYLGLPARLTGLVFNCYEREKNVKSCPPRNALTFAGMDYSGSNGKDGTTMYFATLNKDRQRLKVHKEYYYHPDHSPYQKKIYDFVKDAVEFIQYIYNNNGNNTFEFFVDSSANANDFIEILENELHKQRMYYVQISKVSKTEDTEIERRISTTNLMLASGFLEIDESCHYLIKCFDVAEYSEKTGVYKDDTKNFYTDAFDGFMYAILHQLSEFRSWILSGNVRPVEYNGFAIPTIDKYEE